MSLLLRLLLIVGLTSDALAYFLPFGRELRFNLNALRLRRPWVEGVYLYPLILHVVLHSQP